MVAPTGPLFLHHRISVGFHEKKTEATKCGKFLKVFGTTLNDCVQLYRRELGLL